MVGKHKFSTRVCNFTDGMHFRGPVSQRLRKPRSKVTEPNSLPTDKSEQTFLENSSALQQHRCVVSDQSESTDAETGTKLSCIHIEDVQLRFARPPGFFQRFE